MDKILKFIDISLWLPSSDYMGSVQKNPLFHSGRSHVISALTSFSRKFSFKQSIQVLLEYTLFILPKIYGHCWSKCKSSRTLIGQNTKIPKPWTISVPTERFLKKKITISTHVPRDSLFSVLLQKGHRNTRQHTLRFHYIFRAFIWAVPLPSLTPKTTLPLDSAYITLTKLWPYAKFTKIIQCMYFFIADFVARKTHVSGSSCAPGNSSHRCISGAGLYVPS